MIATDEKRVKTVLFLSLNITAYLAALSEPFLPFSSEKIYGMLKLERCKWNEVTGFLLEPHHHLGETKLLFEKMEDEPVIAQINKLQAIKPKTTAGTNTESEKKSPIANPKPESVSYDDFAKLDLRVGTIEAAVKVAKADKLLQLKVNLGSEVRTIVSGIAEHFTPESLVGKQVCVVANLAPRK